MKNLSLILNGVLFVAVAVLFYFQFSKGSGSKSGGSGTGIASDLKVAYISSDSLVKHFDFVKEASERLEAKKQKLDQDLNNRAQSFRNDYESYQRNQGSLTIGQAKAVEEDLQKKQQNLQLYQQSLTQELQNEEGKFSQALYLKITDFLKTYSKEKGLQLVLKYDQTSNVLFGDAGLDITKDVTDGLNQQYKTEKVSGTKKDSTTVKK